MIFFDIDETLLDFKGAEYLAATALYREWQGCLAESQDAFYARWCAIGKHYFARYLAGDLTFQGQQIARIRDLFGVTGQTMSDTQALVIFERYLETFRESWTPYADAWPCLEALAGHRLGIISNGQAEQQKAKLQKMGMADCFEVMVTSDEVGFAKPHGAIFRRAFAQADIPPACCTYCGDDWAMDMVSSTSVGMQGIWINRRRERVAALGDVREIHSLMELPKLVLYTEEGSPRSMGQ